MGAGTGAMAGASIGAALGGPAGAVAGGIIGAFVGLFSSDDDTEKTLLFTSKGVVFPRLGISLPWGMVIDADRDTERAFAKICFRGGVVISVTDGNWRIASNEDKDRVIELLCCASEQECFNAKKFIKEVTKARNPSEIVQQACEDYAFAINLFRKLKEDKTINCPSYCPADAYNDFIKACQKLPNYDAVIDSTLREDMKESARFWANELPSRKKANDDDRSLFSSLMLYAMKEPTTPTERLSRYDLCLNLRSQDDPHYSERKLLEKRLKLLEDLGSSSFVPTRELIVCQELSCSVPRECGKTVSGVAVLLAQDIKMYNAQQKSPAMRLIFEPGHPRNGVTYVQHPLRPNVYYDVDAFHANMLESKHSELMYLLKNLGAKHVRLSVVNSVTENKTTSHKFDISANGKLKIASANGHVNDQATCGIDSSLYQKLSENAEFSGRVTPHIPKDLIFYPHEEQWRRMAQTALEQGYLRTHVKLEYRKDYAISQRHLTEVEAKLRILIPSFDLHIKADFAERIKRMTETIWDYEVDWQSVSKIAQFFNWLRRTLHIGASDSGVRKDQNN